MLLDEEFAALIRTLESERVEYAVAGALAVAIWGAPRATTDIDLLICRKDVARALLVARGLGFDIVADPMTFQDGTEMCRATKFEGGDQLTLDLLLTDEAAPHWTTRERHPFGDGVVTVVSRDSLIQMKAAAARPQDIADLVKLREIESVSLSGAVTLARVKAASALSDLRPGRRLHAKIDMSGAGIARRIRAASQMLTLCRQLAAVGRGGRPPGR